MYKATLSEFWVRDLRDVPVKQARSFDRWLDNTIAKLEERAPHGDGVEDSTMKKSPTRQVQRAAAPPAGSDLPIYGAPAD